MRPVVSASITFSRQKSSDVHLGEKIFSNQRLFNSAIFPGTMHGNMINIIVNFVDKQCISILAIFPGNIYGNINNIRGYFYLV